MEADVETPKYHASDITDKSKREKLLQDNPTALVKFNTFNRRKGEFFFLPKCFISIMKTRKKTKS